MDTILTAWDINGPVSSSSPVTTEKARYSDTEQGNTFSVTMLKQCL